MSLNIPHQVYEIQAINRNPNKKYGFLDGAGGVGKSHAIATFIKSFELDDQYVFLGPTGKSVSVAEEKGMNGSTLHRFFMIETNDTNDKIQKHLTLRFGTIEYYYAELKKKLIDIKILFIDEVSMINNHLLDFILTTMDIIAPNVMIWLAGDYHQLPPVIDATKVEYVSVGNSIDMVRSAIIKRQMGVVKFITRYRSDNETYNEFLHDLRQGQYLNSVDVANWIAHFFNVWDDNIPLPKELLSKLTFLDQNADEVVRLNKKMLAELPGKVFKSTMKLLTDKYPKNCFRERNYIIDAFQLDNTLEFKIGSKILFRVNDQNGAYKNGDEGIVVDVKQKTVIIKKFSGDNEILLEISKHHYNSSLVDKANGYVIEAEQWPFSLGTARTIHKSQGDGFEWLHINLKFLSYSYLEDDFKWRLMYVVLSRVIDPSKVWIPKSSIEILKNNRNFLKKVGWHKFSLNFESNDMEYQEYLPRTRS